MSSISITVHPPLPVIAQGFHGLSMDLENAQKPLRDAVHKVAIPSIKQNFAQNGRPPWAPLTNFTKTTAREMDPQDNRPVGADTPILDRRAHKPGLKHIATRTERWRITRDRAEFTGFPPTYFYGLVHQFGDPPRQQTGFKGQSFTRGPIPARPFLDLQQRDSDAIQREFANWVTTRAVMRMR